MKRRDNRQDLVTQPVFSRNGVSLYYGDAQTFYKKWDPPTVIVSDGPYGLRNFYNDLDTPEEMPDWYEPHIKAWSERAKPSTTLWFWNSEIGWATVHPVLAKYGWKYVACNVWDKGKAHVAGNVNTKTMRRFPVVTEVCVQYVRDVQVKGTKLKDWLHREWARSGIPFSRTNKVAGVKDAATRKWFDTGWLWYFPPPEAMGKLVDYANTHGDPAGRPYFSLDGKNPVTTSEWSGMRAKFQLPFGVNNVWKAPPVNGKERIKVRGKNVHLNQKPLKFMELTIGVSSDPGDVVWEPFGGLCTGAVASLLLKRRGFSSEIEPHFYNLAMERLKGPYEGYETTEDYWQPPKNHQSKFLQIQPGSTSPSGIG